MGSWLITLAYLAKSAPQPAFGGENSCPGAAWYFSLSEVCGKY